MSENDDRWDVLAEINRELGSKVSEQLLRAVYEMEKRVQFGKDPGRRHQAIREAVERELEE